MENEQNKSEEIVDEAIEGSTEELVEEAVAEEVTEAADEATEEAELEAAEEAAAAKSEDAENDAFEKPEEGEEEEQPAVSGNQLKYILEAALLANGEPLNIDALSGLFGKRNAPPKDEIRTALKELQADYEARGIELIEVASGFRMQVRHTMSPWLGKLWEERPPRYSRALMETLAIIAYRQPLTRGDIEEIRGVAVSTNIIRSLLDRSWIRPVGQRDVPGRPTLYATTKQFLDYFNLKRLEDLPPLAELAELDPVNVQLELGVPEGVEEQSDGVAPGATEPLVAQAEANDLPEEPASVTSLDEVREARAEDEDTEAESEAQSDVIVEEAEAVELSAEAEANDADEAAEEVAKEVSADAAEDAAEEEQPSATVVPINKS